MFAASQVPDVMGGGGFGGVAHGMFVKSKKSIRDG